MSPAGGGWGWLAEKDRQSILQNAEPPSFSPSRGRHGVATYKIDNQNIRYYKKNDNINSDSFQGVNLGLQLFNKPPPMRNGNGTAHKQVCNKQPGLLP